MVLQIANVIAMIHAGSTLCLIFCNRVQTQELKDDTLRPGDIFQPMAKQARGHVSRVFEPVVGSHCYARTDIRGEMSDIFSFNICLCSHIVVSPLLLGILYMLSGREQNLSKFHGCIYQLK